MANHSVNQEMSDYMQKLDMLEAPDLLRLFLSEIQPTIQGLGIGAAVLRLQHPDLWNDME